MAFIPLYDSNPHRFIGRGGQSVTVALIAVNTAIYLIFQSGLLLNIDQETVLSFSLIPAYFNGMEATPEGFLPVPKLFTLLTYSFLHGDIWHLAGNMVFLWVFGDNVEDAVGHWRFLLFYCLSAIAAGLAHVVFVPESASALVGASGACAAIVVAYVMLYPKAKIWILLLGRIPLRFAAVWVLGGWIAIQFWSVVTAPGEDIAWWAHIGGMAAGGVLILVLHRRGVRLFGREAEIPVTALAPGMKGPGEGAGPEAERQPASRFDLP